ncbi:recombinase family protein [Streptomyces sp. NPDC056333]|uniref:recombinase family protein n=1 Tax=Streptomyces sp. NPDC056333 TaxID=3345786 RepID=UPI0035DFF9E4
MPWTTLKAVPTGTGTGMLTVGGYVRISDIGQIGDDRDGREGVVRQREDVYDLAQLKRVDVHRIYEDNDTSAYKRRVKRKHFEEMVLDLHNGVISGILTHDIDRIARQPRDLERLIDIYEQARRPMVFGTTAGDYDLTTEEGRFQARIRVTVANKFSADAARRVVRAAHSAECSARSSLRSCGSSPCASGHPSDLRLEHSSQEWVPHCRRRRSRIGRHCELHPDRNGTHPRLGVRALARVRLRGLLGRAGVGEGVFPAKQSG